VILSIQRYCQQFYFKTFLLPNAYPLRSNRTSKVESRKAVQSGRLKWVELLRKRAYKILIYCVLSKYVDSWWHHH